MKMLLRALDIRWPSFKRKFLSFVCTLLLVSGSFYASAQWTAQTSGTSDALNSVRFVDSLEGWAVGDNGTILHTTNAGEDWVPQTSGTTDRFFSHWFVNDTTGWAVGDAGMIRHTDDGGNTWTAQPSTTSEILRDVHFIDADTGWAVGNNGEIVKTTTGGVTWNSLTSGTGAHLVGVRFIDADTGWVVGTSGTIIKTTDGGSNWSSQTSGVTDHLGEVRFLGPDTGWVVGYSGTILHTTDGGSTWNSQTSGTTETLESTHFVNSSEGWAVGGSGTILHTTDGGSNWSSQTSGTTAHLESIFFPSVHVGWTAGGGGEIHRTSCSTTSSSLTVSACGSYTVPSGDTTYTNSGIYGDTLYNEAACDSIINIDLTITDPLDTTVTEVSASELQANEDTASYQWLDCDNGYAPISGATSQNFSPSSNGNYAVELTDGPCKDTSGCRSVMASSIEGSGSGIDPAYYPNPTEDRVTIELEQKKGPVRVIVRDMQGRKVRSKRVEHPDRFRVQLGAGSGLYHLEIIGDQKAIGSIRVMKEK